MSRQIIFTSLYAAFLLVPLGIIAWITGHPFLFPSVGPSAFLLAMILYGQPTTARRVIGGHTIGTIAGFLSYHLIASGLVITNIAPLLAGEQLRLVTSATVSLLLTSAGMLYTETVHPPACATTLIVSLGFLASVLGSSIIIGSVIVLYVVHFLFIRYVVPSPAVLPEDQSVGL